VSDFPERPNDLRLWPERAAELERTLTAERERIAELMAERDRAAKAWCLKHDEWVAEREKVARLRGLLHDALAMKTAWRPRAEDALRETEVPAPPASNDVVARHDQYFEDWKKEQFGVPPASVSEGEVEAAAEALSETNNLPTYFTEEVWRAFARAALEAAAAKRQEDGR